MVRWRGFNPRRASCPNRRHRKCRSKSTKKELLGQYTNLVMIHHSSEEFTLHFIYVFTDGTHGKLAASAILSPGHAKTPVACSRRKRVAIRGAVRSDFRRDAHPGSSIQHRIRAVGATGPWCGHKRIKDWG